MSIAQHQEQLCSVGYWMIDLAQGYPGASDTPPTSLVQQELREGVNACVIDSLKNFIPSSVIAGAVHLTECTLRQKASNQMSLSPSQSDALLHLARTWFKLLEFFNHDRDLLLIWLDSELNILECSRPRAFLQTTYGRNMLVDLIDEMRFGEIV